jgi:hypothetical protein
MDVNVIGNAVRSGFVVQPVDCDVGAGSSKFHCHCATDPLLRARNQDDPASALHA